MPASRTALARVPNISFSRSSDPNSLTSEAPATLKRSVICVFIAALCCICSREMSCSLRPTRRAGMMNSGSTISASNVSRHSSHSIVISVVTSTTTLLTTLPSVLVTVVWAPTTSPFRRLVIAPVGVRVKNASGSRCTLANSARRRSAISPSPTRALHHRCPTCRKASPSAATTAEPGQPPDLGAIAGRDRVVEDLAHDQRRHERQQRSDQDQREEQPDRAPVRAGEPPHAAACLARELGALHRVDVTRHHRVGTHPHYPQATAGTAECHRVARVWPLASCRC